MKLKQLKAVIVFLAASILLLSCSDDVDYSDDIIGVWQLNSTLEDGSTIPLTAVENQTKIILKDNGLYQLYSATEGITRHGTWLYTPTERMDISMDRKNNEDRHNFDAYEACPVVFLIDEASSNVLQIRTRTTVDERKRFVMFTTKDDEQAYSDLQAAIAAETDLDQKRILTRELMDMDQKMVTYTFTFSRINP